MKEQYLYRFGPFTLSANENVLHRDGKGVPLTPKMFDTLLVLVRNHGQIVDKDTLLKEVWPDSFVEEGNIAFNIRQLRKILGDDAQSPTYIETVPRRGYRFISQVDEVRAKEEEENRPNAPAADPITATTSSFWKSHSAGVAVFVFFLCVTGIGSWYFFAKGTEKPLSVLFAPFASEKISTNGKVFSAAISPDGKKVVYSNVSGGKQSVWLRQLESADNTEIIPPSEDHYFEFVFSPDGASLYFTRQAKGNDHYSAIYRISIFGGVPVMIVSETEGWLSLSPGGQKISFVRCYHRDEEYCSLWIADADGQNERKLVSRPRPFRIGDNEISPDGKSIAFASGQSRNAANEFALSEIDIETGDERELSTQKFFNIKHLAWLPNQDGLLVTAARIPNKHFRIWQVSAATGDAQPLTRDSETYSILSLDKNASSIVSTQIKEDFRLLHFQIENPPAGRPLAEGTSLAFAPDGKILFSSMMSGNNEIWSMGADGSERRQLTNNIAEDVQPLSSSDSRSIFFISNRTGEAHIWRMNADGSNQVQVTKNEGGAPLLASPEGDWLYYRQGLSGTLWRVSLKSGEEQVVWNEPKNFFVVSPDASRFAYPGKQGDENVVVIVSLADFQTLKTIRYAGGGTKMLYLKWVPNGNGMMYILSNSDFEQNTLWLQPLGAAMPQKIADLGDDEISNFELAPDGRSFAVAQGGWKHDAVRITGLK